jgi:hypothetical protein
MDIGEMKIFESATSELISLKSLSPKELEDETSFILEEAKSISSSVGLKVSQPRPKSKITKNKDNNIFLIVTSLFLYVESKHSIWFP